MKILNANYLFIRLGGENGSAKVKGIDRGARGHPGQNTAEEVLDRFLALWECFIRLNLQFIKGEELYALEWGHSQTIGPISLKKREKALSLDHRAVDLKQREIFIFGIAGLLQDHDAVNRVDQGPRGGT